MPDANPPGESCATCRLYLAQGESNGRCRARSPRPGDADLAPLVPADWWCGDYKAA